MENKKMDIARYSIIKEETGNRYRFYCEASGGALCTTHPIRAETPEQELSLAWETEGKKYFNRCRKCGKWVCNAMTNADTLECVDCSPWKNPPKFCSSCGKEVEPMSLYCTECGIRLKIGGGECASAV